MHGQRNIILFHILLLSELCMFRTLFNIICKHVFKSNIFDGGKHGKKIFELFAIQNILCNLPKRDHKWLVGYGISVHYTCIAGLL